jgi:hypothetical protein
MVMFFLTLILDKFFFLEMLLFMNSFYIIFHLLIPLFQIGITTLHLIYLLLMLLITFTLHLHLHPLSILITPFILLLHLLHLHNLTLEFPLEIKRFLLHIFLLLMVIKSLVVILYPILFLTTIYLTPNTFLLCHLFLKLNPNDMMRLSNLIVGNKQCNLNSMLLIRLVLG